MKSKQIRKLLLLIAVLAVLIGIQAVSVLAASPCTVTFVDRDISTTIVTVEAGGTVTEFPPDPVQSGYRFKGWFIFPEQTEQLTAETPVTSDITVVALFQKVWTVTFVDRDVSTTTRTVDDGAAVGPLPVVDGMHWVNFETGAVVNADTVVTSDVTYVTYPHAEEIIPGKAATCTETGLTEGKKCSVCGEILVKQEVIDALGHTEEVIPGKAATCTETGLTEGKKCSVCGEILVKQEVIDALGHTEEVIPGKAATCTETGLTEGKKCSVCGEILVKQEVIDALGHTEEVIPGKAVTCIENGLTEGKKCSVCGETLVKQEVINATGHNYIESTNDNGEKVYTCEHCGDSYVVSIPPTGEDFDLYMVVIVAAVAAAAVVVLLACRKKVRV